MLAHVAWHFLFVACLAACICGAFRARTTGWRATWLLVIATLVRLPFWFASILNNDETSQILVAWDLWHGHLPFTGLWDVKPPGAAVAYGVLLIFGRSLVAVRIGGALAIAGCAALLMHAFADRRNAGTWAGLLVVAFATATEGGLPTLTEHMVLMPIAAMLALLMRESFTTQDAVRAGVLLGVAIAIRTNLVLLFPAAAWIAWRHASPGKPVPSVMALTVGTALPAAIIALVYAAFGQWTALVCGIWLVPRALPYVSLTQIPFAIDDLIWLIARHASGVAAVLWISAMAGICILPGRERRAVAVMWVAMAVSIMAMSAAEQHYLIMAVPLLAFPAGAFLARLVSITPSHIVPATFVVYVALAGLPGRYAEMRLFQDDGYRVAEYLKGAGAAGQYVYALDEAQLSVWLSGARVAGRFADVSELQIAPLLHAWAGPGATTESEWARAFEQHPQFVVLSEGGDYTTPRPVAEQLARDYDRAVIIGRHVVYRRRN